MHDEDLKRELKRLGERLDRLERFVRLPPQSEAIASSDRAVEQARALRGTSTAESQPDEKVIASLLPPVPPPIQPIAPPHAASAGSAPWGMPPLVAPRSETPGVEPPGARIQPPIQAPPHALASKLVQRRDEAGRPDAIPPLAPPSVRNAPPPPSSPPRATISSTTDSTWEMLIGGKLAAWVGAVVVLLAVAFAVKYGIDQGWWGKMPPALRCAMIAVFGGLLLLGGELTLRRIGKAASVGLFSAGLGTLYLDAYATFDHFNLISKEFAFVLMAGVAIVGFALTFRTRFLTIGVLSIIGGYATPVLLRGDSAHDIELLSYLTMLLGISLGLSAFRPRDFRPLRFVALGAHGLIAFAWLVTNQSQWMMAIIFMTLWWAMTLAESVYAAMRRQSAMGNVVMVTLATAAFVTAGCWVLSGPPATSQWLGIFAAVIALLCAVTAIQFGSGLDALRDIPSTAIQKLSVALWAQAGVLIAAAVALQFDGFGQTIGWIAIGLAAIEIGRRLPSRGVAMFGLIVGGLALGRVITIDWMFDRAMTRELWSWGDVTFSRWSMLALLMMGALHAAAHRLRAEPPANWHRMPIALAVIASALWLAVCWAQCEDLSVTAGWLIGAAALLAIHKFGERQRYFDLALAMLLASAARWLTMDTLGERIDPAWSAAAALPLLNWQMGIAVAIAACGWWAFRIWRRREEASLEAGASSGEFATSDRATAISPIGTMWELAVIAGAAFMLFALSFEIDRAVERLAASAPGAPTAGGQHLKQLMLTLLWTFGATGIGVFALAAKQRRQDGRLDPPKLLLRFAWGVLAACTVKWIVFDSFGWRLVEPASFAASAIPIANAQLLVGLALAAGLVVLWRLSRNVWVSQDRASAEPQAAVGAAQWIPVAACAIVLWGLSFEIDRALAAISDPARHFSAWEPPHLRVLLWIALWASGALAMFLIGMRRMMAAMVAAGCAILALAAVVWLTLGTLWWRIVEGVTPAAPLMNVQFLVGALLIALLAIATRILIVRRQEHVSVSGFEQRNTVAVNLGLIAAIGLWLGSFEIDRVFEIELTSKLTGLSIYWGLYSVMLVIVGFGKRIAFCRYAGLALLAVTAAKVLLIDMHGTHTIARVISFLVSGLLLIATSMLYLRLAPVLLGKDEEREAGAVEVR